MGSNCPQGRRFLGSIDSHVGRLVGTGVRSYGSLRLIGLAADIDRYHVL